MVPSSCVVGVFFYVAGAEGLEPPMLAPETRALPLGDAP